MPTEKLEKKICFAPENSASITHDSTLNYQSIVKTKPSFSGSCYLKGMVANLCKRSEPK
jgi:hypothetical protein